MDTETIIGTIIGGLILAAIIGGIQFTWKKRGFLVSKIKSTSLFHFLLKVKELLSDICQRIFQPKIEKNPKPSLQNYILSFGSWQSKSGDGITLTIEIDGQTEIYNNVIDIRASRIDPFTPLYSLSIEQKKSGYALYGRDILGINSSEIQRLARMFYFREVVESQNICL